MLQILQMGRDSDTGVLQGSQAYQCANTHIYHPLAKSSSVKNMNMRFSYDFVWKLCSIKGETIKEHYLYFLYFCFPNLRKLFVLPEILQAAL